MNVNYRKYACAFLCIIPGPWEKNVGFIKGQLISEQICSVLNFPKMQQYIARISALVSKMGQIVKLKAKYHPNECNPIMSDHLSFGIKNCLYYFLV